MHLTSVENRQCCREDKWILACYSAVRDDKTGALLAKQRLQLQLRCFLPLGASCSRRQVASRKHTLVAKPVYTLVDKNKFVNLGGGYLYAYINALHCKWSVIQHIPCINTILHALSISWMNTMLLAYAIRTWYTSGRVYNVANQISDAAQWALHTIYNAQAIYCVGAVYAYNDVQTILYAIPCTRKSPARIYALLQLEYLWHRKRRTHIFFVLHKHTMCMMQNAYKLMPLIGNTQTISTHVLY